MMKVKEIIQYLQKCPLNADVGYEHMKVDYIHRESPTYVEMGGFHTDEIKKLLEVHK